MFERSKNFVIDRRLHLAGAVLASTSVLAACSNDNSVERPAESTATVTVTAESTTTPPTAAPNDGVAFKFDYLNARFKDVKVYASVTDRASVNGRYLDGESEKAICKTDGRKVSSVDPETPARSSDQWLKFYDLGHDHFATAVYIEQPNQVLAQLPEC